MLMKCKMEEFLMNTAECTLRRVKQWQCECSRGEKVDSNAGNAVAATQAKPICQLTFFLLLLLLSIVLHIFLHCFDIPPNGTITEALLCCAKASVGNAH